MKPTPKSNLAPACLVLGCIFAAITGGLLVKGCLIASAAGLALTGIFMLLASHLSEP